ncbi:hypothetical protein HPB51_014877 [Rhipicephalus microplus]|uniref:Uncharacterized protein n=1 Tax=Rhipicephalus microplus TaxID=6941 RepID=A0A9J6DH34_RHIMP|nr:hypothetical protein HPB51_014877 [Rhipicephalus microplus]
MEDAGAGHNNLVADERHAHPPGQDRCGMPERQPRTFSGPLDDDVDNWLKHYERDDISSLIRRVVKEELAQLQAVDTAGVCHQCAFDQRPREPLVPQMRQRYSQPRPNYTDCLTLALDKCGGSAVANAPAFASEPRCGDATAIEVTVKGTEIIPEEVITADWITKVGKHVKELRDSARDQGRQDRDRQGGQDCNARAESGAEPGEDRKKTAAANAIYKKLGHKVAERSIASYLPRLPAKDYKIIICPKCRLALTRVPNTGLSEAVRMAAQIPWIKGQEKEVLIGNDKQGTLIFSTLYIDTVWKVTRIKSIKIEGKNYDVAAPHKCSGRGVVRGIDPRLSVEELTEAFGNSRNPPILGVRKLGNSSSAGSHHLQK